MITESIDHSKMYKAPRSRRGTQVGTVPLERGVVLPTFQTKGVLEGGAGLLGGAVGIDTGV